MNAIYCTSKDLACTQSTRCQQHCKFRRDVQEQHNLIKPLPKTFQPDYGVTRARYTYSLTKFAAWFVLIATGLAFSAGFIYVVRHF